MTNLEDRIIAYLDGTLDETSRAELLHTLSVSPDKRKLLEEHIKLREIISLGHKPASVPLAIERKLADRIPVLMQELPYLAEKSHRIAPIIGIRSTSYLTTLGNSISGFFASRFGPAISLASLVVLGGLSWYAYTLNLSPDQTISNDTTAETQLLNSPSLKAEKRGESETIAQSSSSISSTMAAESQLDAQREIGASKLSVNATEGSLVRTRLERHPRSTEQKVVKSVDRSNAVNDNANDRALPSSSELSNSEVGSASSSEMNAKELNASSNSASTDRAEESNRSSDQPKPVETVVSEPNKNAIKDPVQESPPLPLPSQSKTVTGRFSAQLDFSNGMSVRPNQKSQQYETSAGKSFPIAGLAYALSPNLSIGVEAGASVLSQQREEVNTFEHQGSSPAGSLISVNRTIEYTTGIVDVSAYWSQATVRYTLNPEDRFRYEVTGGAGAAFVGGVAPMVSLGGGATYDLSERFAFTFGVSARAAWLSGAAAETDESSAPLAGETVAIVSHRSSTEQVFSSSIAGRLGIRFGF